MPRNAAQAVMPRKPCPLRSIATEAAYSVNARPQTTAATSAIMTMDRISTQSYLAMARGLRAVSRLLFDLHQTRPEPASVWLKHLIDEHDRE
jgi:hypothetical protein